MYVTWCKSNVPLINYIRWRIKIHFATNFRICYLPPDYSHCHARVKRALRRDTPNWRLHTHARHAAISLGKNLSYTSLFSMLRMAINMLKAVWSCWWIYCMWWNEYFQGWCLNADISQGKYSWGNRLLLCGSDVCANTWQAAMVPCMRTHNAYSNNQGDSSVHVTPVFIM